MDRPTAPRTPDPLGTFVLRTVYLLIGLVVAGLLLMRIWQPDSPDPIPNAAAVSSPSAGQPPAGGSPTSPTATAAASPAASPSASPAAHRTATPRSTATATAARTATPTATGSPSVTATPTATATATATATTEPTAAATVPPGVLVYVVQEGDTLGSIAGQFGVSVEDIVALNAIADPDVIEVGQELLIPTGSVP